MGSNTRTLTSGGFNSVHIASELKDVRILDILLKNSDPELLNLKTGTGISPIMSASAGGNMDNMNLLLEKGSDPWELGPNNYNSFDLIALGGSLDLLK